MLDQLEIKEHENTESAQIIKLGTGVKAHLKIYIICKMTFILILNQDILKSNLETNSVILKLIISEAYISNKILKFYLLMSFQTKKVYNFIGNFLNQKKAIILKILICKALRHLMFKALKTQLHTMSHSLDRILLLIKLKTIRILRNLMTNITRHITITQNYCKTKDDKFRF